MIIIFDLDNTLFDEKEFIKSGFEAVSCFMENSWQIPRRKSLIDLESFFNKDGRGRIFDSVLKKNGHYSKTNVKKCLSIYRTHKPVIHLYPDAERCLKRLNKLPLYIVTDGNKMVQDKKIEALRLREKIKKVVITYRHGIKNSKPSPYCFLKIAKWENANPREIIYIGDNPTKDFVGIKPHGFKTIRLRRGEHSNLRLSNEHEAHRDIYSLDELNIKYLKELEQQNE